LNPAGRVGHGALAQGAEGWPQEEGDLRIMPARELRAEGEGLGGGVGGDGEVVVRGDDSEVDVLLLRGVDRSLGGGGQQIGGQHLRAGGFAVVSAEREPAPRIHPGLRMEAVVLVEAERGAVYDGEAHVGIVAAESRLLGPDEGWEKPDGDGKRSGGRQTEYDSQSSGPRKTEME
jgi:hypothetical protein